jgi:ubiquinone/menaquinone biosynthesis C-methylase UbiE
MFGFMEQFKRPTGFRGRIVATFMNQGHRPLSSWGLSHVDIDPKWIILDVGCGGGRTVGRMAQRTILGKVFGMDYSPDMVKYSKKVNKKLIAENRVEIIEGSVETMSFPDDFFDLVTAFETYYFWNNVLAAFKEIKRVLKPNGAFLIVNEMVKDGVYEVKHEKMIRQTDVRLIPLEEIRNTLYSAGFSNVQIITKEGSSWNAFLARNG